MTDTPALPRPPRPSATIVVVRAAAAGFEVLMLRRADKGDQNSGAWVFPGGLVDRADRECHALCVGMDDAQASERLGLAKGGLDYYVAAIRESFEEAGVLFAHDAQGVVPALGASGAAHRLALAQGQQDFRLFLHEAGWFLGADRLHYIAHCVTPVGMPKRFDTRFFLSILPDGQQPLHDGREILEHGWFTPAELLAAGAAMKMLGVTRSILAMLPRWGSVDELLAWARAPRTVRMMTRRRSRGASGPVNVPPEHPAWTEVGRLDPSGEGSTWCELRPGVPVRLSPRVQRVTREDPAAGNGYIIGDEAAGWALLDPCPVDQRQLEAMLAATGESCRAILLTGESVPAGIAELARRTGAKLLLAARSSEPMRDLDGLTLHAVRLPQGHGWLLPEERTLFSGAWAPAQDAPGNGAPVEADWIAPALGFLRGTAQGGAPLG